MAHTESTSLNVEDAGWMNTTESIEAAFDVLARDHDTFTRSQPPSLADLTTWDAIQRCLPTSGDGPVLDAGGGNGIWAIKIAQLGYRVVMIDISNEMLRCAASNSKAAGLHDHIQLQHANAHHLETLPADAFPLVLAVGDLLNYTREPEKILAELCRVCRPGGIILVTVIGRNGLIGPVLRTGDQVALVRLLSDGDWEERSAEEMASHIAREPHVPPLRLHAFTPEEVRHLFLNAGLQPRRLFARGIISSLLPTEEVSEFATHVGMDTLLAWELRLANDPSLLGCSLGIGLEAQKP